jgi:sugar-specific transcriptional regulator TrmB
MSQAKARLLAAQEGDALKKRKEDLNNKIDQKQRQIEQLKKGLPSRYNRMKVSEQEQINKRKQVLELKQDIQDLRQQILKVN